MAVILIRTVILYAFTVLTMRMMGKRQIGELETSELVVTILISELVTLPMQDADYPLVYAFIPVFALVGMELLTSVSLMKSRLFRNFLSGSYSVIIADGKLNQQEMSRSQITIDELMEELRQKGALNIDEVKFCILETSGKISVILKKDCQSTALPAMIIVDGKLIKSNLVKAKMSRNQISGILKKYQVKSEKDVFFLSVCDGQVILIKKDQT